MKLNEVNDNPLVEGPGWDSLKHLGRRAIGGQDSEMSLQDKMAKDSFINNFIGKAIGALNSQIQSGKVDPNMTASTGSSTPPTNSPPPANAAPAAGAAPTQPSTARVAPDNAGAPARAQPGAGAFSNMASNLADRPTDSSTGGTTTGVVSHNAGAPAATNVPPKNNFTVPGAVTPKLKGKLPTKAPAPAPAPAPKPAQPQDQSLDLDVYRQQQAAKRGADVQGQQNAIQQMQQTAAANAAKAEADNNLVARVKAAKAKSGGLRSHEERLAIKQGAEKGIHENTKYAKLNAIFESILLNEAVSISDYLKRFTTNYLKADVNAADPELQIEIDRLTKKIESTYKKDKGKAAFRELANFAYGEAAAGGTAPQATSPTAPQTRRPTAPQTRRPTAPQATSPVAPGSVPKVKQVMNMVRQLSPQQQQQLFNQLQAQLPRRNP